MARKTDYQKYLEVFAQTSERASRIKPSSPWGSVSIPLPHPPPEVRQVEVVRPKCPKLLSSPRVRVKIKPQPKPTDWRAR